MDITCGFAGASSGQAMDWLRQSGYGLSVQAEETSESCRDRRRLQLVAPTDYVVAGYFQFLC